MALLGSGINPLGHVLDVDLVGGPRPVFRGTEQWGDYVGLTNQPLVTMHMITLILAALLLWWALTSAARAIATGPKSEGNDRYRTCSRFGQLIEVIVIYLSEKAIRPVLGKDANRYLPFLLTLFFFILVCNLLGLFPFVDLQHISDVLFDVDLGGESAMDWAVFGGTVTSNLAVTAGLAALAFIVIQVHGFRELGIGGWLKHLSGGAPMYLLPIMVPVELMSLLIKPAALAIRLFANMVAGHTLMATLSLFGYMAYSSLGWAGVIGISIPSILFALAISFLEIFVAFLQAFIFMFLTTVFIGQLSHHDEDDEKETGTEHALEYRDAPAHG